MVINIGDKVYASDWCYGTVVDIDTEHDIVSVEFETSGGGGTASFSIGEVHPETATDEKDNTLDIIHKVLSSVEDEMDQGAPCLNTKCMRPELCKKCKFNEVRAKKLGYSCENYYKAKALIDAGLCIESDLVDQIFKEIETAMVLSLIPAHVRGVEDVPDYYEGDLTEAIANIKKKFQKSEDC